MNESAFHQSIKEELMRNLLARRDRNNGDIYMTDVISEAKFCIAVNIKISERQIRERLGDPNGIVLPETIDLLLIGIHKAIMSFYPNNFTEVEFNQVKDGYKQLLANPLAKEVINNHYNDLYQDYTSNIL
jgi:hypothetical protein